MTGFRTFLAFVAAGLVACDGLPMDLQPEPIHASFATATAGGIADLVWTAAATAVDNGPQDGVFDAFTVLNFGSVNDNGHTSFRTVVVYDLAAVPAGATVQSATLKLTIRNHEGNRSIAVHGHPGDGVVSLSDFARDGLVGVATVDASGSQTRVLDVTSLVTAAVAGTRMAEFGIREAPPNAANYTVMNIDLTGTPVLSVQYSLPVASVTIDVKPGSSENAIRYVPSGKIPVAILSTPDFDARSAMDPETIRFGRSGQERSLISCNIRGEDVNRDGWTDLICQFRIERTGLRPGDTAAVLRARTRAGESLTGSDIVRIIG